MELSLKRVAQGEAVDDRWIFRLFNKLRDREIIVYPHQAQPFDFGNRKRYGGHRDVCATRDVLLNNRPEIHPIELVSR